MSVIVGHMGSEFVQQWTAQRSCFGRNCDITVMSCGRNCDNSSLQASTTEGDGGSDEEDFDSAETASTPPEQHLHPSPPQFAEPSTPAYPAYYPGNINQMQGVVLVPQHLLSPDMSRLAASTTSWCNAAGAPSAQWWTWTQQPPSFAGFSPVIWGQFYHQQNIGDKQFQHQQNVRCYNGQTGEARRRCPSVSSGGFVEAGSTGYLLLSSLKQKSKGASGETAKLRLVPRRSVVPRNFGSPTGPPRFRQIYLQALNTIARALERTMVVSSTWSDSRAENVGAARVDMGNEDREFLLTTFGGVGQEEARDIATRITKSVFDENVGEGDADEPPSRTIGCGGREGVVGCWFGAEETPAVLLAPLAAADCHERKLLQQSRWVFFAAIARRVANNHAFLTESWGNFWGDRRLQIVVDGLLSSEKEVLRRLGRDVGGGIGEEHPNGIGEEHPSLNGY